MSANTEIALLKKIKNMQTSFYFIMFVLSIFFGHESILLAYKNRKHRRRLKYSVVVRGISNVSMVTHLKKNSFKKHGNILQIQWLMNCSS